MNIWKIECRSNKGANKKAKTEVKWQGYGDECPDLISYWDKINYIITHSTVRHVWCNTETEAVEMLLSNMVSS